MKKLNEYLKEISTTEHGAAERVLYLYDTRNKTYFSATIYPAHIDFDGIDYKFADEPFSDYEYLNVIRAWTVDNMINCVMGLEALIGNYGESEVE